MQRKTAGMRRTLICFSLLIILGLWVSSAHARPSSRPGNFGLGVILGEPTGLSGKMWHDQTKAMDFALAWSAGDSSFHFHLDYLVHTFKRTHQPKGNVPFYYGIGARIVEKKEGVKGTDDKTHFGARVPLGLDFLMKKENPLEFFIEVAPVLDFTPRSDLDVEAGGGVRYYF